MSWFKIDDLLHAHRKVQKLLHRARGLVSTKSGPNCHAMGLWVMAGSWCSQSRTDGFVPEYVLPQWDANAAALAAELVAVGLWEVAEQDGDRGFQFHDFADYNPTRALLESRAETQRRKVELHRDHQLITAIRGRDGERCRYCGTAVNFPDKRSNLGGTYDHVDPDGPNTLPNVVVACRGCNTAKSRRTPQQWGFALLRPGSMGPARPIRTVPRSGFKSDPDTEEMSPGSRPGEAGSGTGGAGTGPNPDLDHDPDTGEVLS